MNNPDEKKVAAAKARAAALSPEERKEIARGAAQKRWDVQKDIPQAEYTGNLVIGDMSFPCSVLTGGTRILTQTDFMKGMGMYYSGWVATNKKQDGDLGELPHFLNFESLAPYVERHVGDLQSIVVKYRTERGAIAHGIKAEIIPKLCDIWIDADDEGAFGSSARQKKIAAKARVMMRALAHVGIIALVDEATGYQAARPQDALQKYLEMLVRKELAVWAKKFPDEFYENIYKLRGWTWPGMGKNRYSVVAQYTRDLVYERMAPGLLKDLEAKSPKDEKGNRSAKLHQWLTGDIGDPMLASHLQSVLTLQRLAIANGWGWTKFMRMVDQVMKKKGDTLDLPFGDDEAL